MSSAVSATPPGGQHQEPEPAAAKDQQQNGREQDQAITVAFGMAPGLTNTWRCCGRHHCGLLRFRIARYSAPPACSRRPGSVVTHPRVIHLCAVGAAGPYGRAIRSSGSPTKG